MNKNTNLLITIVVTLGFLFFWEAFVVSKYTPKPSPKPVIATDTAQPAKVASPQAASLQKTDIAKVASPTETIIYLNAPRHEVALTTKGGGIVSWKFEEDDKNWVDLVDHGMPSDVHPLSLYPDLVYGIDSKSDTAVQLSARHSSGIIIKKSLKLLSEPPFHETKISFQNAAGTPLELKARYGWEGGLGKRMVSLTEKKPDDATKAEMRTVGFAGNVRSWRAGFIRNRTIDTTFAGPFEWFGVDNHHFLAAFVPTAPQPSVHILADRKTNPAIFAPINLTLNPGETKTETFKLFVGPKKYAELSALPHNLGKAIDFGFFGIIAKGLFRSLEFFHGLTKNYGWAIILLTISIQILVFPLTRKSLAHSVRMRELQPQMKAIQAQFKEDPKRLQVEMLNLYRKNGMKMMGMEGCVPILLQIPIFFAFYSTLNVAYELRGASWLWIKDLGQFDPTYILPILMGLGMFLQQKMTTVAADPAQAKMMMFMPVIMTFMFLKLPAGLTLYWSINSIVTIIIQQILTWKKHSQTAPSSQ